MQPQRHTAYNSFQTAKGNRIWAGALCLAWTELKDKFAKEEIAVRSDSQAVKDVVDNFNRSQFTAKDIDPQCFYVKSGYGQETVERINQEVREKFPEKTFKDLSLRLKERDIISYAYLLKKIAFEVKFERRLEKEFRFNKKPVESFHSRNKEQNAQITCNSYADENNFVVSLQSKSNPRDLIYLLKDSRELRVEDVVDLVREGESNEHRQKLEKRDYFEMPVIDIDCENHVKEVIGQSLLNESLKGYVFGDVVERVKLNVDESGVKCENEAVIMMLGCAMNPVPPKMILLDSDFWLVMKEQGSHPYLCVHIVDPTDQI